MRNLLLNQLLMEKATKNHNGIYYYTQTEFTYNTNKIEGSKLSIEHTKSLFETKSIITKENELILSDDIIETNNHFKAFDFILENAELLLDEDFIKELHKILKSGTQQAELEHFKLGDYKIIENMVGGVLTTHPRKVKIDIKKLLANYIEQTRNKVDIENITDFHYRFERIHPFSDGNGRVGRLIAFKECLKHNIVPFIVADFHKAFYYRGLREYENEKGYLIDTLKSAQDSYIEKCEMLVPYFIESLKKQSQKSINKSKMHKDSKQENKQDTYHGR